jgi:hypothetical protein
MVRRQSDYPQTANPTQWPGLSPFTQEGVQSVTVALQTVSGFSVNRMRGHFPSNPGTILAVPNPYCFAASILFISGTISFEA